MSRMTIRTAREFYSYGEDAKAINELQMMGFRFNDWGNGLCLIESNHVDMLDQTIMDLARKFGEVSVTPDVVTIMNWMRAQDLAPND